MAEIVGEGEQNRLIQANLELPRSVVSRSRKGKISLRALGLKKGIPSEELEAEGMAALVKASRKCTSSESFTNYADKVIEFAIRDFIDSWQEFEPLDLNTHDAEKLIYEWQNFMFAIYERWDGDPHSPESLLIKFEEVASTPEIVANAFIGLSPLERKLIQEYFILEPRRPLEQIARDHKMSYMRAGVAIHRALGKMREAIKNQQPKRPETNIIAFPARAGRLIKKSDRPNNQVGQQ